MRRSRFSEERIIGILKERQAGLSAAEPCRKHGISEPTFYKWRSKYGGVPDVGESVADVTLVELRECPELCVSGLAHAGFRYGHAVKRSLDMIAI